MSKNWSDFDKFENVINKYMPERGEGETLASQAVTAVNKLIYKWYNDGDVYDNTGVLDGWANDISSYANWLWVHMERIGADAILERIGDCYTGGDYEDLLYDLAECVLDDEFLERMNKEPKAGTIYSCNGMFMFVDFDYAEEEF